MQQLVRNQDNLSPFYWELLDENGVAIDGSVCDWILVCKASLSKSAADAMSPITGSWDSVNKVVVFEPVESDMANLVPGATYFLQANGLSKVTGKPLYTEQATMVVNASLGTGVAVP